MGLSRPRRGKARRGGAADREGGLWEEAELDAADGELVGLVLKASGRRVTLPPESVTLLDEAAPTDSEDDGDSSDGVEARDRAAGPLEVGRCALLLADC